MTAMDALGRVLLDAVLDTGSQVRLLAFVVRGLGDDAAVEAQLREALGFYRRRLEVAGDEAAGSIAAAVDRALS